MGGCICAIAIQSDCSSRLVKIFMRRDCNTEVSRRGAHDSRCQVADWAQAEQGQGRAQGCLGGFFSGDNDQGKRSGRAAARLRRTRLVSISIPLSPIAPISRRRHSGLDSAPGVESLLYHQPRASPGTPSRTSCRDHAGRIAAAPGIPYSSPFALRAICCIQAWSGCRVIPARLTRRLSR